MVVEGDIGRRMFLKMANYLMENLPTNLKKKKMMWEERILLHFAMEGEDQPFGQL